MKPDDGMARPSQAEEQLLRHLGALREHPPEPDSALAVAVVRTVRWQATVRPFAQAAGRLVGAIGDSARLMARAAEA
jgi:hypothetical protein